ncbi:hypothetical protein BDW22DRAFT_1484227 [Trametopsis cervina]|nr:hypothetical protein BDW22DRAFT_1484227 [Trametopsis cervina]
MPGDIPPNEYTDNTMSNDFNPQSFDDVRAGADLDRPPFQVSSAFHLDANLDSTLPDVIIASADNVLFAVHCHRLQEASANNFAGFLSVTGVEPTSENPLTFVVTDPQDVLNVVLHTLYGLSCGAYNPSLDCLAASIQALKTYGLIPLQRYLSRNASPLYSTVLNQGLAHPIETFALAASHGLEDLAVAASSYTLSAKLDHIPPHLAEQMGVHYLHRLYRLQSARMEGLKRLLDKSVYPHVATPWCSPEQRQNVSRAVQLAATQVYYTATPATTRAGIESIMHGLANSIQCPDCKQVVETHVKEIADAWILLDRTI